MAVFFSGTPFLSAGKSKASAKKQSTATTATKRPPTAYNLFLSDMVKHRQSDEKVQSAFKDASKQYSALSPADKKPYQMEALRLRTEYKQEKDENTPPKRPKSGYQFFMKDQMPKRGDGVALTDFIKQISGPYHNLSESDKKKYAKLAEKDKERYKKEMEEYEIRHPSEVKLRTRAPSAYNLFVHEYKTKNNVGGQLLTKAAEEWKKMTDADKQTYKDMAADEKALLEKQKQERDKKGKEKEQNIVLINKKNKKSAKWRNHDWIFPNVVFFLFVP